MGKLAVQLNLDSAAVAAVGLGAILYSKNKAGNRRMNFCRLVSFGVFGDHLPFLNLVAFLTSGEHKTSDSCFRGIKTFRGKKAVVTD